MDHEGTILTKITQTEKNKYYIILLICDVESKKMEPIDTKKRLMLARCGEGKAQMSEVVKRYKLSIIGYISPGITYSIVTGVLCIWKLLRE